ncbi:MAG: ABC transporter substrate-binding protein [Lachnospiraceae bacterium]|nr:ABC transporter substrate-binding protein [Lachnospiraceae bacterium]
MKFKKALSVALCASMVAGCFATVASADEDLTWKIGGIGPITGAASAYGSAAMNGAQIAVDEINAAGGINGYQIEFQAEDDEHDAEKSVNAYNTLKDWGMQALVGTVTTAPCLAVAPLAAEDNIFMITPSASAVDTISYGDNEFRMCFSDPSQGSASAQYIGENLDVTKVGVIYDSSDVYSSGIYATFRTEAENYDFEIVAAEAFTSDSKTDFSTQIQAMIDAGAELVFLPFYYNEASIVFTQASSMEYSPLWFGVDGMDGILSMEGFDLSLAEGVMLLTPFSADAEDELTQNFVATYQDLYGEIPNQFAADGYDCVYVIKTALETTELDPSADASTISDALQAAMVEITMDGLTGEGMVWTADGEVSKSPKAVVIQDGVYVGL